MTLPSRYCGAALICGLTPLAIGIGIIPRWTAIRRHWPMIVAGLAIVGAAVSVSGGAGRLFACALAAGRAEPKSPFGQRIAVARIALLIGLLAALLLILAVFGLPQHSQITIVNQGPDLERFVLSGACAEIDLGTIASGMTRVVSIDVARRGTGEFRTLRGGQEIRGVVDDNVFPHRLIDATVAFSPEGDWSVGSGGLVHF